MFVFVITIIPTERGTSDEESFEKIFRLHFVSLNMT